MDLRLIIAGVAGVLFLIALCHVVSKKSKSRKYLNKSQFLLLIVVLGAIIAYCFLFVGKTIIRNSTGDATTDYADESDKKIGDKSDEGDGTVDMLILTVHLDQIIIGDSSYTDIIEVQQIIAGAVAEGKNLRLIDDYALADTYNQIIDVITQMNISRSSIEEIEQP